MNGYENLSDDMTLRARQVFGSSAVAIRSRDRYYCYYDGREYCFNEEFNEWLMIVPDRVEDPIVYTEIYIPIRGLNDIVRAVREYQLRIAEIRERQRTYSISKRPPA